MSGPSKRRAGTGQAGRHTLNLGNDEVAASDRSRQMIRRWCLQMKPSGRPDRDVRRTRRSPVAMTAQRSTALGSEVVLTSQRTMASHRHEFTHLASDHNDTRAPGAALALPGPNESRTHRARPRDRRPRPRVGCFVGIDPDHRRCLLLEGMELWQARLIRPLRCSIELASPQRDAGRQAVR